MSRIEQYRNRLNASFASWDYLLYEDVQRLDHRLIKAMDDAVADRIPREVVVEFYGEKLSELMDRVVNNRETDKQQARRQLEASNRRETDRLAYIYRPNAKTTQKRK